MSSHLGPDMVRPIPQQAPVDREDSATWNSSASSASIHSNPEEEFTTDSRHEGNSAPRRSARLAVERNEPAFNGSADSRFTSPPAAEEMEVSNSYDSAFVEMERFAYADESDPHSVDHPFEAGNSEDNLNPFSRHTTESTSSNSQHYIVTGRLTNAGVREPPGNGIRPPQHSHRRQGRHHESSSDEEDENTDSFVARMQHRRNRQKRARNRRQQFYSSLLPYDVNETPDATPPFFHDVLGHILLFLPIDLDILMAVRRTCRTWRFFSGLLPHWAHYRIVRDMNTRVTYYTSERQNPPLNREQMLEVAIKAEQDALLAERRQLQWHSVNILLFLLISALILVAVFFVGYDDSGIRNDSSVGALSFFVGFLTFYALSRLSAAERINRYETIEANKDRRVTLLVGFLLLSIFFGPILSLLGIRMRYAQQIAEVPVADTAGIAQLPCDDWNSLGPVPYIRLDAPLSEWRLNTTGSFGGLYYYHLYRHIPVSPSLAKTLEACHPQYRPPNGSSFNATEAFSGDGRWLNLTVANTSRGEEDRGTIAFVVEHVAIWVPLPEYLHTLNVTNATTYRGFYNTPYYLVSWQPNWFRSDNPMWANFRAYFLLIDHPEDHSTAAERVKDLQLVAGILLSIASAVALFYILLSCGLTREQTHALRVVGVIVACIILNPLVMIASGVLCLQSKPPTWMMCDQSGGGALVSLGVMLAISSAHIIIRSRKSS